MCLFEVFQIVIRIFNKRCLLKDRSIYGMVAMLMVAMFRMIELFKLIIGKTLKPNQASCQHAV